MGYTLQILNKEEMWSYLNYSYLIFWVNLYEEFHMGLPRVEGGFMKSE